MRISRSSKMTMSPNGDQEREDIWKVYIPHKLLMSPSGFLCGFLYHERYVACVTAVSAEEVVKQLESNKENLQCLGYWHASQEFMDRYENALMMNSKQEQSTSTVWMDIYMSEENSLACSFKNLSCNKKKPSERLVTCILYNAAELLSSHFLCDDGRCSSISDVGLTSIEILVYFLYQYRKLDLTETLKTDSYLGLIKHKSVPFGHQVIWVISTFICWLYFALGKILNCRLMNHRYARAIINHMAFLHQIEIRCLQVKRSRAMSEREHMQKIRILNVNTQLILDMMFGVIFMVVLMWSGATETLAQYIITWADSVVVWLNNLLDWLMGVPAGLKLNSQLDQFLGRFFHYHIYLWTGYLTLLKPVLAPLLWYSTMVGVLGLSAQLCLLQDIFSTLTIHIYCFYVYAARLYCFQLYGLSSLWRLFRGKKWNVLRRRVDSAPYDVDQLFVGTLLFTILLFLLPTTALYYVVFLGLRLLLLSLTGVVSRTVSLINSLPVYGLLLRLFRSNRVTGDIMLTVLPNQTRGHCLFVEMKAIHVSFGHVVKLLREDSVKISPQPQYTWGNLLHRMFIGELIYPWVERAAKSVKT
ncbi:phosphatidylinositol N-acetylglucosaminyltransferase subunit Q-like [Liolophura sinensis]|uniref:phosphatidylinositol N-acetylglucosaminyltransferase subunit Q-like n=1 Tax=Liolophura sinensis TaxID=3198878 RepID=UPI00315850FC